MVDRMVFTPELEAAAHRLAAAASKHKRFSMGAGYGSLDYVLIEDEGSYHFYTLVNGEWCRAEPVEEL